MRRGAPRGRAHLGKTLAFTADSTVKAAATLPPGDPARVAYEALLRDLGISGAELIRLALVEMHERRQGEPRTEDDEQMCLKEAI